MIWEKIQKFENTELFKSSFYIAGQEQGTKSSVKNVAGFASKVNE